MGLVIRVGLFGRDFSNGSNAAPGIRELDAVNQLLGANGLPMHKEPLLPPASPLENREFPYSHMHFLRRAVAYSRQSVKELLPLDSDADPTVDSLLDIETYSLMESHVICHSDYDGYYVPILFPVPLFQTNEYPIQGGILGSSFQVLAELIKVAPLLGIEVFERQNFANPVQGIGVVANNDFSIERAVWLSLFCAARQSIYSKAMIVFC